MNDDLQKALADILNKTTQGVEAGVGFLQRELPEVIHQLLVWKAAQSGILFAGFVAFTIVCIFGAKKVFAWGKEEGCGAEAFTVFPILFAMGGLLFAFNELDWLQILIAPKLYLVEYAASLVK